MPNPINYLVLSYPNFTLGTIINPDEANQNNSDIVNKVNEFVDEVYEAATNSEEAVETANEATEFANEAFANSGVAVSVANSANVNATNAINKATSVENDYNILKPEIEQIAAEAQAAVDEIENFISDAVLNKVGVVVSSGSFVALSNGVTNFTIPSDKYNPLYDYLDLFKNGLLLQPTVDYTISGRDVTLTVGINTGQSIFYRAMKNILITDDLTDGAFLLAGSVPKSALEDVLVDEIEGKVDIINSNLLSDSIKGTSQTPTYTGDNITQILHKLLSNNSTVRTDVFNYSVANQITETRTLSTGQSIIIKYYFNPDGSYNRTEVI